MGRRRAVGIIKSVCRLAADWESKGKWRRTFCICCSCRVNKAKRETRARRALIVLHWYIWKLLNISWVRRSARRKTHRPALSCCWFYWSSVTWHTTRNAILIVSRLVYVRSYVDIYALSYTQQSWLLVRWQTVRWVTRGHWDHVCKRALIPVPTLFQGWLKGGILGPERPHLIIHKAGICSSRFQLVQKTLQQQRTFFCLGSDNPSDVMG